MGVPESLIPHRPGVVDGFDDDDDDDDDGVVLDDDEGSGVTLLDDDELDGVTLIDDEDGLLLLELDGLEELDEDGLLLEGKLDDDEEELLLLEDDDELDDDELLLPEDEDDADELLLLLLEDELLLEDDDDELEDGLLLDGGTQSPPNNGVTVKCVCGQAVAGPLVAGGGGSYISVACLSRAASVSNSTLPLPEYVLMPEKAISWGHMKIGLNETSGPQPSG